MKTLLALLLLASCGAASAATQEPYNAPTYRDADALYLKRDEPGAVEQARRLLQDALAAYPLDSGLLWRYGRAQLVLAESEGLWSRGGHYAAAEKALQAAIDVDPVLVDARYWLAVERYRRGRHKAALEAVKVALVMAPDDARLHHLAGEILWHSSRLTGGDRRLALEQYEKALRLSGRDPAVYVSLAEAYVELGRGQDAVAVIERLDQLRDSAAAGLPAEEQGRLDRLRRRLKL